MNSENFEIILRELQMSMTLPDKEVQPIIPISN